MVSSAQLIGFMLVSLMLIVVPGPGVLFIIGRALSHGRRTATATAAGHAAGNYIVAALVAFRLPPRSGGSRAQVPVMCSGRTGTWFSGSPVAARTAATMAGPEEIVGGSPTPRSP